MEAEKKLGEKIKSIREKDLFLTQKDLAEKLNVSTVYISYLEKGKRFPSVEFISSLYNLKGESVPDEIIQMLKDIKKNTKAKKISSLPTDIAYELEEKEIYDYRKLKTLLKTNPQDLILIYGIIRILIEEGKTKEAKKYLLKYLMKVEKTEDKKWLEASYYELEGNLPLTIQFLQEAIIEFNKSHNTLDEKNVKTKARLIFQLASIHFRYGQELYKKDDKEGAIENFKNSLNLHNEVRNIFKDPFYQMDYAGIFLWLALLGNEQKQNWENYIIHAKEALLLNHYKGIENFSSSQWKALYTKRYLISTISFLGRAYAQIAIFEKNPDKKLSLLNEGEFLFIQHTPIDLSPGHKEYYRFYFNEACFYSLKAEIYYSLKKSFEPELDRCYVNLQEANFSDKNNKFNLFSKESNSSEGLNFYRKKRTKELSEIIKS